MNEQKGVFQSPELQNFRPEDYHFFGLWPQKLFSCSFWIACYDADIMRELGIDSEEVGSLELTEGNFCIKKSELENIQRQVYQKIDERDEEFFKNLVTVADRYFQEILTYKETVKDKRLDAEDFEDFLVHARKINLIWLLGAEQFSEHVQRRLDEVVARENFPTEEVPLIIPALETPLNQQNREVLVFKKEIGGMSLEEIQEQNPALYQRLCEHVSQFGWIEIHNFEGEPFTLERLYEQIQLATDQEVSVKTPTTSLSLELAFLARAMSYCGYLRQVGAEYFSILSLEAQPYFRAIAEKLGLTYDEFLLVRDVEVLEALKGELSPESLKTIAARRTSKNFVLFAGKGKEVIFVEETPDIELIKKRLLPQAEENLTSLRGQIGNKGNYVGRARIIMNNQDFEKMQDGDVLVSTMTTPDFVVLMHKAGAIVTDIGGMLCHAAIVSREIGKPCIIGTQFATQVLKDGDLVEVDADNGMVRLLEV
jgi:phosphohistidine swiveling domain-containing protein